MSPRASASNPRNNLPYSRRPSSAHPKSSRQQFSACGACRMRRVRCDLKDLPMTSGPHPACSNCKERGLKCVDEFADVKAVKLLRRGRRLQQVEAIYGKVDDPENTIDPSSSASRQSIIPHLHPDFFNSPFWLWFSVQRPVLDPVEFPTRFYAHTKGTHSLPSEGRLLAMLLVVWAASFGVDEHGIEDNDFDSDSRPSSSSSRTTDAPFRDSLLEQRRRDRKSRTDLMVREILALIDRYGVLRRPTWDGVRVLLLLLPLLDEAPPLDRLSICETTLSQAHALSALAAAPHASDDAHVRARIFWYAHVHEAITTGLHGGRLTLTADDLDALQSTLPPLAPAPSYLQGSHIFTLPLRVGTVCRRVHAALTGPRAKRRAEHGGGVDADGMREVWDGLDRCWDDFEALRRHSIAGAEDDEFEIDRFASGWQIFIFECHNVIREALKQHIMSHAGSPPLFHAHSPPSRPMSQHGPDSRYLYAHATRRCTRLLPPVLALIQRHLGRGLFKFDAGLVRDGVFFAAYLTAGGDASSAPDRAPKQEDAGGDPAAAREEDGAALCLRALAEMRWAFAKSEERAASVRMVWETRRRAQYGAAQLDAGMELGGGAYHRGYDEAGYGGKAHAHPASAAHGLIPGTRPLLPPLSLALSPMRTLVDSAPNTGGSPDGSGAGWHSYTPPGTGTSAGTSAGTGGRSPVYGGGAGMQGGFKGEAEAAFYHVAAADLDPFSFGVAGLGAEGHAMAGYSRGSSHPQQQHAPIHGSEYMDPAIFSGQGPLMGHGAPDDVNACPQFGDDCHGYYH